MTAFRPALFRSALLLLLVLALAACGGEGDTADSTETATDTADEATTEPVEEEPAEDPAEEATTEPVEEEPAEEATEAPTEAAAAGPEIDWTSTVDIRDHLVAEGLPWAAEVDWDQGEGAIGWTTGGFLRFYPASNPVDPALAMEICEYAWPLASGSGTIQTVEVVEGGLQGTPVVTATTESGGCAAV